MNTPLVWENGVPEQARAKVVERQDGARFGVKVTTYRADEPHPHDEVGAAIHEAVAQINAKGESVLTTALGLVYGERHVEHGAFDETMERAARIARELTPAFEGTGYDVAQVMRAVKLARQAASPDAVDNYVDEAGYTDIAYRLRK